MLVLQEMEADNDWRMIGALCGGILLLCICLALGIIYFLKFAKPKKPGTVLKGQCHEMVG
jgi:hypothetical protein